MSWNKILITAAQYILEVSRFLAILVFPVLVYILLFQGGNDIPLRVDGSFGIQMDDVFEVKPEVAEMIEVADLRATSFNANLGFDKQFKAVFIATLLVALLGYIALLHLLLKLVLSAKNRTFFESKNVLRIRIIGFGFIAYALYKYLFERYSDNVFQKYFAPLSFNDDPGFSMPNLFQGSLFLGIMLLIMAQAFDYGLKLQKEQELTI